MNKTKQKSITYHLFVCATKLATKVAQNKFLTTRLVLMVNFGKKKKGKQILKVVLHQNEKDYQGIDKEYQIGDFPSEDIQLWV